MKLLSIVLFLFALASDAAAQTTDSIDVVPIRLGAALGVSGNAHGAGFVRLPGTLNCCPEFTSGWGTGPYASLIGYVPLSSTWRLGLRTTYLRQDAVLSRTEPIAVEGEDGPIATSIEHTIDATLASFSGELRAEVAATRRLWFSFGTRVGAMTESRFSQVETLGDEAPGTFNNGRRTQNEYSGEIPDAARIGAAILLGTGFDLPLDANGYLKATPEFTLGLAVTSVNDSVTWMPHALQLGVAFTYDFAHYRKPEPVIVPPPPMLSAEIAFAPVGTDRTVSVREVLDIRHSPVVPAVFFDSGSVAIASRYRLLESDSVASYSLSGFDSDDFVGHHRDLLNVIAYRLTKNPKASITLVASQPQEESDAVGRARISAIRSYLEKTWGIAPSRITVASTNGPLRKASEKSADGRDENRHVGIRASDPAIVAPIMTQSERWEFEPDEVTILPRITAEAGIQEATVDVAVNGRATRSIRYGSPEWPRGEELRWDVSSRVLASDSLPASVTAALRVVDASGQTAVATTDSSVSVVGARIVNRGRIETVNRRRRVKYQLVAVPLGSPELDPINRALMSELAAQVRPGATITIRGYSDRLGDPAYNLKLSQRRADIASSTLRELLPPDIRDHVTIDAKGGGVDTTRFTNDLAEGRILTRGVSVILEQDE